MPEVTRADRSTSARTTVGVSGPSSLVGRLLRRDRSSSAAVRSPVERRRLRALLLGAVAFAVIVVGAMLPWSALASQHRALATDTAQANQLQAENQALGGQVKQLSDPSAASSLARQDYGLVKQGQRAYDILPSSGTSSSPAADSGHVPLNQAPVAPGSPRSQELLSAGLGRASAGGSATGSSAGKTTTGTTSGGSGTRPAPATGSGGFWSRVGHTLAFWS
jgi:cell division protein FtsB